MKIGREALSRMVNQWRKGIVERPFILFGVLVYALLVILDYEYVPSAGIAMECTIAYLLLESAVHSRNRWKPFRFVIPILMVALYGAYITTTSFGMRVGLSNLADMLFVLGFTGHFIKGNAMDEIYGEVKQSFLGLLYFLVIGLTISLAIFFLSLIFDYSMGNMWKYILALAGSSGLFLAFLYEKDGSEVPGKFTKRLFGDFLPYGMVFTGILAGVFFLQVLLGFREDVRLLYAYVPGILVGFLFYLISSYCGMNYGFRKWIRIEFFVITLISFALVVKRMMFMEGYALNGVYPLLAHIFFLLYLGEAIHGIEEGKENILKHFALFSVGISLLMTFPLIGYEGYHRLQKVEWVNEERFSRYDLQGAFERKVESSLESHRKLRENVLEGDFGERQIYVDFKEQQVIDGTLQGRKLYLEQRMHWSEPGGDDLGSRKYVLANGKEVLLTLKENTLTVDGTSFDLLEAAKEAKRKGKGNEKEKGPRLEGEGYVLFVTHISAGERKEHSSVTFHLLEK